VLVAILPGLYALRSWDLTPPGPWWGLRALAVLEGRWFDQAGPLGVGTPAEARAYRQVCLQPPLYAWLEAAALAASGQRTPVATVIPSYVAGAILVLLVYQHGRLWGGAAIGLIAAVLTGFNRDLLLQMQQATPATLGLTTTLGALGAYGRALRARGRRRAAWALLSALCLGASLLSVALFGLVVVPIVALHQALLRQELPPPDARPGRRRAWLRRLWINRLTVATAGLAVLALGLLIAAPWHLAMARRHGPAFWATLLEPLPASSPAPHNLIDRLLLLAPASVVLGLYGAVRAGRGLLAAPPGIRNPAIVGTALWLAWMAIAALLPALLPAGPRPVTQLFLLVPLNLFAARTMLELANRQIPARALRLLAPATVAALIWWASPGLRGAALKLALGQPPDSASRWVLPIALAGLILLIATTALLHRWVGPSDRRQRLALGTFLGGVLALTVFGGLREVNFRHRETSDLLALREAILRRHARRPLDVVAVVGPEAEIPELEREPATRLNPAWSGALPGGRLRFILRAALPRVPQIEVRDGNDLLALPDGQRLVILAGSETPLSYALQARLRLESLHPGHQGILDAYATPVEPPSSPNPHP
jgi:4-amino-4-deoxy-L-arabinose transferase-like glycosyltransferase